MKIPLQIKFRNMTGNSVIQPGFEHLKTGAEVYFAEEEGEKPPARRARYD